MSQRSLRERCLQTLCYEAFGVALVTPLFVSMHGGHASDGLTLMIAISVVVMIWAPLYGWVFDWIEGRQTDRVASDRPPTMRLVHAVFFETTSIAMTLPLAMWLGGLSITEALSMNIWLTLFYVAYAYVFFVVYDLIRPVARHATPTPTGACAAVAS